MDLRTGKIYEIYEDAVAAGVPESDIAKVKCDHEHIMVEFNKKYPERHQGNRERLRRLALLDTKPGE